MAADKNESMNTLGSVLREY